MSLIIKRAHALLGGPYHGAVKMIRDTEQTYSLPGRSKLTHGRAYDDVRALMHTVLYVRVPTQHGDVFVDSSCGPNARTLLIRRYEDDTDTQNHGAR